MKTISMPALASRLFATALLAVIGCGKAAPPPAVEVSVVEPPARQSLTKPTEPVAGSVQPELGPDPRTFVDKATTPSEQEKSPAEAPAAKASTFAFPDDRGGKLLEGSLPPQPVVIKPERVTVTPRERALPDFLTNGPSQLPVAADAPATLPLAPRREFVPVSLPERILPDFAPATPMLPAQPIPDAGPAYKQSMRDPAQPAELPFLATKPVPERASLEDPTVEFTAQSVISLVLPLRETVAPFVKLTIPEPFEPAGPPIPRGALTEDANKALTPPPPPKP